jgi:hypothetical protein
MMLAPFTAIVRSTSVLLQTDRPELIAARDASGALYLCLLVQADQDGYHYVAIRTAEGRLEQLQRGEIDLRSIVVEPDFGTPYLVGIVSDQRDWEAMKFTAADGLRDEWLPDAGLKLTDFTPELSREPVAIEAVKRGEPVVVCQIHPPESLGGRLRINADRMAECLQDFQSLVRHATRFVLSKEDKERRSFYGDDPGLLQVVGVSEGSFNIHMSAGSHITDLFGASPLTDAMMQIDQLMELTKRGPEDALIDLKKRQGQVLSAYENLLKFVVETQTVLEYRWAAPGTQEAGGARVTPVAANAMVGLLATEDTIKSDPFEMFGQFRAVNTTQEPMTWAAWESEKHRMRRGVLHPDYRSALDGVTIKGSTYHIVGETRLMKPVTGKQTSRIFLKKATPVK